MTRTISGLVVLVIAAVLARYWWRLQRANKRIREENSGPAKRAFQLITPEPSGDGMVDISGTIISPPTLRAPVTGRACSVWELTLSAAQYSDGEVSWSTRWVTGRAGDLVIEYDVRQDLGRDPHTKRIVQRSGPAGTVAIPGDRIQVVIPVSSGSPMPGLTMTANGIHDQPANVDILGQVGLPADLLAAVRSRPDQFRVAEGVVGPGDFLRVGQGPVRPPYVAPDPVLPFQVIPVPQEFFAARGVGCLALPLLILTIVITLFGVALLRPA